MFCTLVQHALVRPGISTFLASVGQPEAAVGRRTTESTPAEERALDTLQLQLTDIVSLKTDGLPLGSYTARGGGSGFNFIRVQVWGLDACTDFRCF